MSNFLIAIALVMITSIACEAQANIGGKRVQSSMPIVSKPAMEIGVVTGYVNLRDRPEGHTGGSNVLAVLSAGDIVTVIDRDGAWCEVAHDDIRGWMLCAWLQ